MKKLYFILFASLFFLIPSSVFASNDNVHFFTGWKYNGSTLPVVNNTTYAYKQVTPNALNNWESLSFTNEYPSLTANQYDYFIFDIFVYTTTSDAVEYSYNQTTDVFSTGVTFSVQTTQYRGNNITSVPCSNLGSINSGESTTYTIQCPIVQNTTSLSTLDFKYYLTDPSSGGVSSVIFGVNRWAIRHVSGTSASDITGAINQQTTETTNAINDVNDSINDMNDNINNSTVTESSSTANNFFNGFRTEANGHLTSIVTAPLTLFASLTSNTCTPVTLPFNFDILHNILGIDIADKNIVLPCGTTLFWENPSLAPKVTNFRTFWNLLLGAPAIYGCLVLLMKSFNNALDPLNDEIVYLVDDQVSTQRKLEKKKEKESGNSD